MEKVIPPGLNYADYKPEAIENYIRMIKFLPVSNVMNYGPNDVVRFNLQGNGFFDPYSAYIKIRVRTNEIIALPNPQKILSGKFLDRSAHSLISRLVIRSQGTELERIEYYDVLAAMINDMIYSKEYRYLHHYEGFAGRTLVSNNYMDFETSYTDFFSALSLLSQEGPDPVDGHFGDRGFYRIFADDQDPDEAQRNGGLLYLGRVNGRLPIGVDTYGDIVSSADMIHVKEDGTYEVKDSNPTLGWDANNDAQGNFLFGIYNSPTEMEFCIPIYSGIIGVLMPDKKLLPLSLLPLEVEFTMNPYAFYSVGEHKERSYVVSSFEIWTHTLFFEQELHRSLEAVVAYNGIFIHYNSFYLTPINSYNTTVIPKYHYLGCFLKSVEALHWVFLYSSEYVKPDGPRKLNFVSHNLYNLYLRNGMDLIPSEPIPAYPYRGTFNQLGRMGTHNQLLIETYKAWNKMHDPLSDGAINAFNYCIDTPYIKTLAGGDVLLRPETYHDFVTQYTYIGRCQYGLSLVGEEIGQNKTIVSGKKTVLPFDLNFEGSKSAQFPSIMLCYLRADFIIYVRPDLIVTRLGL